jgi:hypothetical protein
LNLNLAATAVFVALFLFATWLGFVAAHWRKADLNILHEWGLSGRRFGTLITWFLLGGDLYTAYAFIALRLCSAPAPRAFSSSPMRCSPIPFSISSFLSCGRSHASGAT